MIPLQSTLFNVVFHACLKLLQLLLSYTSLDNNCLLVSHFMFVNYNNITQMSEELLFDPKQINLPYTIALIKPDTVLDSEKLTALIADIQNKFVIKNMIQRELFKQQAMNLFYKHSGKPYFDQLIQYLTSGQCCVMVLCADDADPIQKWKSIIGPSNPQDAKKSAPDSFRAKYGKNLVRNQFHGSDSILEANKQRKIFQFKIPQKPPQFIEDPYKITFTNIKQFLQPPNLEHTCINERMDLLALYGPIVNWHSIEQCFCQKCIPIARDQAKKLKGNRPAKDKFKPLKVLKEADTRQIYEQLCQKCQNHCSSFTHLVGGRQMQHILTDHEIKELIYEVNKKQLIEMLAIEKGSTSKIMIQKIPIKEPDEIVYNMDFFMLLLQQIDTDYYERYDFTELQNLILQDRRIRISYWVAKIVGKSVDRFPSVTTLDNTLTSQQLKDPKSPFFTLNRKLPLTLLKKPQQIKNVPLLYPPSIVDKAKLYPMQENLVTEKMLHRNLTKVMNLGGKKEGIKQAVTLLRPYNQGRHGDWNNYSSLKGNSLPGQVGGKNMNQFMNSDKGK